MVIGVSASTKVGMDNKEVIRKREEITQQYDWKKCKPNAYTIFIAAAFTSVSGSTGKCLCPRRTLCRLYAQSVWFTIFRAVDEPDTLTQTLNCKGEQSLRRLDRLLPVWCTEEISIDRCRTCIYVFRIILLHGPTSLGPVVLLAYVLFQLVRVLSFPYWALVYFWCAYTFVNCW